MATIRNRITRLLLPWCRSPRIGRSESKRISERNMGGNRPPGGRTISKHMSKAAVVSSTLIPNQHIAPVMVGNTMRGWSVMGMIGGFGKSIRS
jgi:hypothetical protein